MRINHNISAQLANVNLKRADNRMSSALERLSSGYKINKAADDSTGIAISNKMRAQIRSLDQATRNAVDGQSIIQTAEGALSEIEAVVQRMRELSVQAASDTCTIDDRKAVQQEIDKLLEEVDRIADTTEFNGNGLLDGSCTRVVTFSEDGFDSLELSEGVEAGNYTIKVDGVAKPAEVANFNYTIPASGSNTIEINGVCINIASTDTYTTVDEKIISTCDTLGINAVGGNGTFTFTTRANGESQVINVRDMNSGTTESAKGQNAEVTLVSGFATDDNGDITAITSCEGNIVTIKDQSGFSMKITVEENAVVGQDVDVAVYDTGSMLIQIGANEHQNLAVDFPEVSCRTLGFKESDGDSLVNVCSQYGASNAISIFDDAIRSISSSRSRLGASENRLDTTVSSLEVTSENMTESMSQIMDTDMATSMTEYTQEDVLSQAATAILAQANNRPQQIMSLLQS